MASGAALPRTAAELLADQDVEALRALLEGRWRGVVRPHWDAALELLGRLGGTLPDGLPSALLDQPVVTVGGEDTLPPAVRELLRESVTALFPWRKGPFSLAGLSVDAEWRSDMKFARLEPWIPPLDGGRVLDVGCNNGYYLFRLAGLANRRNEVPALLFGVDPSERFQLQFLLLQRLLRVARCHYAMLGVEELGAFRQTFDLVLCLGIVYHQRDPLSSLQQLRGTMTPGATLILESQTIPGSEPVALFAPDRYAKARNVYFVPTPSCLAAWATRAGFRGARVVSEVMVTAEEQRSTELAPYESFSDYLDPADTALTVEGFPAPRRTIVVATA